MLYLFFVGFFFGYCGLGGGISGCSRPNVLPSGSAAMANHPTVGIWFFGTMIFPPSFVTLSVYWSMFSTLM